MNKSTNSVIFLRDAKTFYDKKKKRKLNEKEAASAVAQAWGLDDDAITPALDLIRAQPIPDSEVITGKANLRIVLNDIYQSFAEEMQLVRSVDKGIAILYRIDEQNQVTYVGTMKEELFRTQIGSRPELIKFLTYELDAGEYANIVGQKLDLTQLIREMYLRFELDPDRLLKREPALLSWGDEPAYKVLDSTAIEQGEHATWDEFTERIDFPETFKAFVWSIFEPRNFGRQALWVKGEGNDGKSTAMNAIATYFGRSHVFSIGLGSYDRDFFFGEAFGKRLAIYMDCKNQAVLRRERIKSLLGKDTVSINQKYEKAFSAQIYAKLLVASNWPPQINFLDDSERTRLLYLQVSSYTNEFGDPDFQLKLEREMPYFLHTCRESYEEQCPNGMSLRVPEEMQNNIKLYCTASDADLLDEFLIEKLEFSSNYYVPTTELRNSLKEYYAKNWESTQSKYAYDNLMRILTKRGIKAGRLQKDGSRHRVLIGLRLKGTEYISDKFDKE